MIDFNPDVMPPAYILPAISDMDFGTDNCKPGACSNPSIGEAFISIADTVGVNVGFIGGTSHVAGNVIDTSMGSNIHTTETTFVYHDYKGWATDPLYAGVNFMSNGSNDYKTADDLSWGDRTLIVYHKRVNNKYFSIGTGVLTGGSLLMVSDNTSNVGDIWSYKDAMVHTTYNTITSYGHIGKFENEGTMISDTGTVLAIGNTGTVDSITNTGLIQGGKYAIVNAGHITGDVINTAGTFTDPVTGVLTPGINGGILNGGTIGGNIKLNGAELILAGDSAFVGGDITGIIGDGSVVSVGDDTYTAFHNATGKALVDHINVAHGSTLTLSSQADWHALQSTVDAFSNGGTVVMNTDSILHGNLTNTGSLTMSTENGGMRTINGNVVNSGSIVLNPVTTSAGNTLTINGNYTGTTGSIVSLGGIFGGDTSLTDKLVITGDSAGNSILNIRNENGSGAQTLEGIQVVSVGGFSGGTFTQGGRVVAGAYDYTLRQGNVSGSDMKGWYLTSYNPVPDQNPDIDPDYGQGSNSAPGTDPTVKPDPGVDPDYQITPVKPVSPSAERRVRPETGAYSANLQATRDLFSLSLGDRETQYADSGSNGRMWIRNEGGHNRVSMSDGQNKTTANRYVLQLGGDVLVRESQDKGRTTVGVMAGYANQHSNTRNSLTGHSAKGSVEGYSMGLYGTWYQHPSDSTGMYVDSWLQYGWFDNMVKGNGLAQEKYKSSGLSASAEGGYNWQFATLTGSSKGEVSAWLQPHAQVIWSGVAADDHREHNGTRVEGEDGSNVQTRMGVRVYLKGSSAKDLGTGREFRVFAESNWLHNTQSAEVSMNGSVGQLSGVQNVAELKTGVEGRLSSNLTVWGNVSQQIGGKGYSDTEGVIGMKYTF